jgi:uncharacterized membrane protein (UPF0127 family)
MTLTMRTLAFAISIAALITAFTIIAHAADETQRLAVEPVTVATDNGNLSFSAELATNDKERSVGLMFRRSMGEREAMLFYWKQPEPVSMWMRNTYIPLDMLFVDADGTIVHIAANTVPHSLEVISAGRDVSAVMEINGGTAARLNITAGNRLLHRFFNRS